jgi:hypothetical protein
MERLGSTVIPTNATNLAELLDESRKRGRAPRALRLASPVAVRRRQR